jgi:hypothetical protein
MADKIMLFLGIWFVASVLVGMAVGRMIQAGEAMPEAKRSGSPAQRASRRAA